MRRKRETRGRISNRFAELLPSHWILTTVSRVGEVQLGRQLSPAYKKGIHPTPYIRAANITVDGLDLSDVLKMDFDPADQERYLLTAGDVLLAEASGGVQHVGRSAVWRNEIERCCFQNTVIRFRVRGISFDFAHLVFRFLADTGEFGRAARGVGILHLGATRFASMPFPLPPPREQVLIAARANRLLDRLKGVRKRLISALEKVESHAKKTKVSLLGLHRIYPEVYADLGIVDEHGGKSAARLVQVGDLCTATNGRAFKSSEWGSTGLPILRIQNLKDRTAPFNYYSGEISQKHRVEPGDLLFAWSGTPGTSFGAFLWQGPTGALNQHIFKIETKDSIVRKDYLYHALNGLVEWFIVKARGGGGLAHIAKSDFLNAQVELLTLDDQKERVAVLHELETWRQNQTAHIRDSLQRLEQLQSAVLERALSGRLRKRVPGDEPADALLHRIERDTTPGIRRQRTVPSSSRVGPIPRSSRIRPLVEVLKEKGPMTAQELILGAGYHTDVEGEVEVFYAELSGGLRAGRITAYVDPLSRKRVLKAGG